MKRKTKKQAATYKREPIPKKLRFEILKRDNFTCRYCGQSAPDVVLHADHIKPVAKGGTNDPSNLVAACSACNSGKSDMDIFSEDTLRDYKTGIISVIINLLENNDCCLTLREIKRRVKRRGVDINHVILSNNDIFKVEKVYGRGRPLVMCFLIKRDEVSK